MIIDRPTPATQNGLEHVIRGWLKWVFCKAFKKHKLCSSWRVQKAYWVGIAKSFADFCTCFSLVITPHNMSVSILFVCTATHVPWRRVQKAYWVGIAKSFADFCTCCWFLHLLQLGHYSTTCLSPTSLSALLHMCRGAGYKKLIEWGLPSHLLIFAPASAW